jgi:hypothetical protein
MQLRSMILTGFGLAGAMAAPLLVASICSAQTATSQAPATTPTTTAPAVRKPSSATSRMIDEAIQRTQARAAKFRDSGVPEQFGSEEPFTYTPGKTF